MFLIILTKHLLHDHIIGTEILPNINMNGRVLWLECFLCFIQERDYCPMFWINTVKEGPLCVDWFSLELPLISYGPMVHFY